MDRAEIQASMSVEVAKDISTREVINLAPHSIEEAEFKAHRIDGAEVQVSMSVEVAPDIPTREIVKTQGNTDQPIQKEVVPKKEVVTKKVDTVQPIQEKVVIKQVITAQPAQQFIAMQQRNQHEGAMVKEADIKPVHTAQPAQHVPAIQQGDQHESVVDKKLISKQDTQLLNHSLGDDGVDDDDDSDVFHDSE